MGDRVDEDICCLNPGCTNFVAMGRNGPTTQCAIHLEKHRLRNTKYCRKKKEALSILKQKADMFDVLQKKYEDLLHAHKILIQEHQRLGKLKVKM